MRIVGCLLITTMLIATMGLSLADSEGVQVKIIDVHCTTQGVDERLDPNSEWVELRNNGTALVDLTDWIITDEVGYKRGDWRGHRYHFPEFTLRPGASVRVYTGVGDDTSTELYWGRSPGRSAPIWNNDGDTAYLIDIDGEVVDVYTYPK